MATMNPNLSLKVEARETSPRLPIVTDSPTSSTTSSVPISDEARRIEATIVRQEAERRRAAG